MTVKANACLYCVLAVESTAGNHAQIVPPFDCGESKWPGVMLGNRMRINLWPSLLYKHSRAGQHLTLPTLRHHHGLIGSNCAVCTTQIRTKMDGYLAIRVSLRRSSY
jgi:hypothetical protein